MKTGKIFNVVQENISALAADNQTRRWMRGRKQICWKCQEDKHLKGGMIKFFGTVRRFICVDCALAKQIAIAKGEKQS